MHAFTMPSGVEIELREMTGAEEEILTDRRLVRKGEAIDRVLANCVARIGDNAEPTLPDVLDLLSGDRLFALVRLRQILLGDEVELETNCANPACRETNTVMIDLKDLEVSPFGPEREFSFALPGSGRTVRFEHLDGHKERRLAALKEPNIASAMLIRILDIDGKPPSRKALSEMSLRDRQSLRREMARVDAGIDTVVEIACEACGAPIRTRLEAEPAFLFPAVRSRATPSSSPTADCTGDSRRSAR